MLYSIVISASKQVFLLRPAKFTLTEKGNREANVQEQALQSSQLFLDKQWCRKVAKHQYKLHRSYKAPISIAIPTCEVYC